MKSPLLEVAAIAKSFDGVDAVRDVSLSLDDGDVVAVIGPNGAGKTTLFNLIHGEILADSGDVYFDGRSIVGLATHAIARRGIGRTFQVPATFASMTVGESMTLVLAARARRDGEVLSAMMPADARGKPLLERLQIADLVDTHCAALAYGDAKRVELALALAGKPRVLLLDEPTAGMNARARRELMQVVVDLARDDDVALLFTEHDMDIVFGFARRVVVLDRGSVIADGSPQSVRGDPRVRAAYLGDDKGQRG
ncbi:MAG TPA: ABC transporter ATP-binding protein [Casimicrobiaceae bacterium]|nr:ABC transporter ATP-binding protein [Casimicrobiaceae bacterium]